jgi:hypothetical protein
VLFLADRTQIFVVNGKRSVQVPFRCSVPQGSGLGPEEFIAYPEEIEAVFKQQDVNYHLFDDDKQVSLDGALTTFSVHIVNSRIA